MDVLIIGCGKVGFEISKNLIKKDFIDNLFLYDKDIENSKNIINLLKDNRLKLLEKISKLKDIDLAIITLSTLSHEKRKKVFIDCKNTFEVRQSELKGNISAFNSLVKKLRLLPQNCIILVVTNPVEEMVYFLNKKLHDRVIYGFGLSLDVVRYSNILDKEVVCVGEHGSAIPLLNLKNKEEYSLLHQKMDEEVMNFLRMKGMTNVITAKEMTKVIESFYLKSGHIYLAKQADMFGIKNVVISLPLIYKNGVLVDSDLKLSNIESGMLKDQVLAIKSRLLKIK